MIAPTSEPAPALPAGEPSPAGGWRLLRASVAGTSHGKTGAPCQDASDAARLPSPEGEVLGLACSDGAGSARLSHEGASLACAAVLWEVRDFLERRPLRAATRDTVEGWFLSVHAAVADRALELDAKPRDLACTLLVALIAPDAAVFAQIGDGAIVVDAPDPAGYAPIFWPQSGEYANMTYFATEPEALRQLSAGFIRDRPIQEVALFSDGLQQLALRFEDRSVHAPFFRPMFAQLRRQPSGDAPALDAGLRTFLNSSAVNSRTDDDKTLVLATRRAPTPAPGAEAAATLRISDEADHRFRRKPITRFARSRSGISLKPITAGRS